MYLPGEIHERIGDLRSNKGLSQKELSDIIGIVPSQLSRIESGKIRNISSDVLIKLAKALCVSTDYILGLTAISTPKNYDISELGLSEGAVRALVRGNLDMQSLNLLIEHKSFPYLTGMVKTYLDNSTSVGVMERNALIDMATATLGDFVKDNPEHRAEAQKDALYLKSQKLAKNEAELEKIKSTFLAIIKDIKKAFPSEEGLKQTVTAELLQTMREQIKADRQNQKPVSKEAVIAAVLNMVGQTVELDEKSAELFKVLMRQLLTNPNE